MRASTSVHTGMRAVAISWNPSDINGNVDVLHSVNYLILLAVLF